MNVNPLRIDERYFGWPLARCQNLIQNTFNQSVSRLAKLGETAVLLSGGLDSRLVAGCLRWHLPYKAPIITLGETADYEMQCARKVAKALGWPFQPLAVDLQAYRKWAPVQASLEGMQTSFVEFMWWQALGTVHALKPRLMTGFLGDAVMGATQIAFGLGKTNHEYTFDAQFARTSRYGFSAADISRLLKAPGLGEAVVDELRTRWNTYDGLSFQKCWQFDLEHRQRLHVAPAAWRLSFGAWPTLPYASAELLEVMGSMAGPAMGGRHAQYEMLKSRFPKLARLPLDRSGNDTTPVVPTLAWTLGHRLRVLIDALLPRGTTERRQYVRHFDVNSTGWQAVRELAETRRPEAETLFAHEVLAEMLPALGTPLRAPDPIIDGARYKTLMGLMLQLGSNIAKTPV